MSTKEKVLELLKNSGSNYISGQEMADKLYVTRAAIWKAIKTLQNAGYPIEAVTNRGYRIAQEYSVPNEEVIRDYLKKRPVPNFSKAYGLHIYKEVESTNDTIRGFADEELSVVIASSQTRGRGRRGRSFFSPDGSGLYMSILLHPDMTADQATRLTCIMAVAITRAIEKVTGIATGIKWVNDIFLNDLKIAGILTEAVTSIEDGSLSYVIIGIGINLYEPKDGFPADIKKIAGALFDKEQNPDMSSILSAEIIASFLEIYNDIENSGYIEEYKRRSCLIGKYVKVMQYINDSKQPGNSYAIAMGIDDECRLVVKYDDGRIEGLRTGEVSVVSY